MINKKDYIDYLHSLIDSVFAILPLYEEGNKYLPEYIESVYFKVSNVKEIVQHLDNGAWYVETLAVLNGLIKECEKDNNKKFIKKTVFGTIDIIENKIKSLEQE